jgi:TetR/AcrR family transcriptional regulator
MGKESSGLRLGSKPFTAKPGRRKLERNGDLTKNRILQCATAEFAQKGYAGARMSSIVSAAGVNISLVYQYFGDKDGLFLRVMEDAYKLMRRYHREMELQDKEPVAAMEELVRSTFRIFCDFPNLIGLLNAENLNEARHIRNSAEIHSMYNPLLDAIRDILARGVATEVFRTGIDATELFITINSVGYFYLSNRHTLGYILHQDLTDPERIKLREDHIVEVISSYLRKQ